MSKSYRLRKRIKEFLATGPKSTAEILEHINVTTRYGTTKNQVGNILSGDADIEPVGMVRVVGVKSNSYKVKQWKLKEGD